MPSIRVDSTNVQSGARFVSAMIGSHIIVLACHLWTTWAVAPHPSPAYPPQYDPQVWLNFEGEVLEFLLVHGTDLVGRNLGLPDVRVLDALLSGVTVDKLYDARISSTPILKGFGFNEFSVDTGFDLHVRLEVDSFVTGDHNKSAAITLFDVRTKVKLVVEDLFRSSCRTRLSPTALSFGQVLIITGGKKIIIDETSGKQPYPRSVLQETVLDYLNENLFHILDDVLTYNNYVCNR